MGCKGNSPTSQWVDVFDAENLIKETSFSWRKNFASLHVPEAINHKASRCAGGRADPQRRDGIDSLVLPLPRSWSRSTKHTKSNHNSSCCRDASCICTNELLWELQRTFAGWTIVIHFLRGNEFISVFCWSGGLSLVFVGFGSKRVGRCIAGWRLKNDDGTVWGSNPKNSWSMRRFFSGKYFFLKQINLNILILFARNPSKSPNEH